MLNVFDRAANDGMVVFGADTMDVSAGGRNDFVGVCDDTNVSAGLIVVDEMIRGPSIFFVAMAVAVDVVAAAIELAATDDEATLPSLLMEKTM